jgi:crossover junction endodeoxyribonuclease RuvC
MVEMSKRAVVGIDPGQKGGVAVLNPAGDFVGGFRMPLIEHRGKKLVDATGLGHKLEALIPERAVAAFVVEQVNAMPKQGVASSFQFGRMLGAVEACALLHPSSASVNWVTPAVWKKALGLSSNKRASLDAARLRFGDLPLWGVLANDGIAEAALIAAYWRGISG